MKPEENKEIWVNHVNNFKSSNLSQVTWARKNGINVIALRYWLKKLDNGRLTSLNNSTAGFEFASVSITSDISFPSVVVM